MNLLKLIENRKNKYNIRTGAIIFLELIIQNKVIKFEGFVISIKKKNNLTILRKINNFYFKMLIKIDSPIIKNIKIIKILKKKKSKIYNNFNYFY